MSALPPKADMCGAARDVRFGPIADIGRINFNVRHTLLPRKLEISQVKKSAI
jgi:hypothetical protein